MTEGEKNVSNEAFEKSLDGLSDEEKASKRKEREDLSNNDTDLENALKEERSLRLKAQQDLEETRRKAKEAYEERARKRQESGLDYEDPEEKPLTRSELESALASEREKTQKEMRLERASELAKKISENNTEAELTLEVWRNRTFPGTVEEQISEAHAIATSKKIRARNSELQRALANGETGDGFNSQRKPSASDTEPNINPVDKVAVAGMTWDKNKQAYKKTIAGGRKVFFVSKDLKKRWTEDAN